MGFLVGVCLLLYCLPPNPRIVRMRQWFTRFMDLRHRQEEPLKLETAGFCAPAPAPAPARLLSLPQTTCCGQAA